MTTCHECLAKHLFVHQLNIYITPNCILCNNKVPMDQEHLLSCEVVQEQHNISKYVQNDNWPWLSSKASTRKSPEYLHLTKLYPVQNLSPHGPGTSSQMWGSTRTRQHIKVCSDWQLVMTLSKHLWRTNTYTLSNCVLCNSKSHTLRNKTPVKIGARLEPVEYTETRYTKNELKKIHENFKKSTKPGQKWKQVSTKRVR